MFLGRCVALEAAWGRTGAFPSARNLVRTQPWTQLGTGVPLPCAELRVPALCPHWTLSEMTYGPCQDQTSSLPALTPARTMTHPRSRPTGRRLSSRRPGPIQIYMPQS